ncbi:MULTISPECIES: cell division protein FtsL [Bacillaceae]|jgi:cell division protein FtsL|uniref:Cell division protein FtsL n=1 Tax=Caldibacillus thermoamylovorans TaxID=35841 RepID=A0A090IT91_9BACI|nr:MULTISPECIES: cell division protein FtsL [Bacillaceae]NWN96138.1 cell division protein FtsL [Bacillus sp. (in: firmicutes)]KIO59103.1 hypothetical protein B4065_0924 [Caldibacillus thermoamylovorans]KIO65739.1 hypothetical protein B4064_2522 [Caldibacillus thermoamylovorans]KIO70822.1 hypothetical protein B4166_1447 [Caldibacillus thermoamylovorans]KIO74256.1 hypothetical protein B4167_1541 [Caldibacillus thermoamylovorans]
MSNLAKKYQSVEIQQPKTLAKPKVKKNLFTKGEKVLYILFATVVCFFSVKIVSNQAHIYQVNKEIQQVEATIEKQEKVTEDLKAQMNEYSNYKRVMQEAKEQGLKNNADNVKVVPGK